MDGTYQKGSLRSMTYIMLSCKAYTLAYPRSWWLLNGQPLCNSVRWCNLTSFLIKISCDNFLFMSRHEGAFRSNKGPFQMITLEDGAFGWPSWHCTSIEELVHMLCWSKFNRDISLCYLCRKHKILGCLGKIIIMTRHQIHSGGKKLSEFNWK